MKNIISLILIAAAVWIFWSYTDPIYKEANGLKEVRNDYQIKLSQANEFRRKYENLSVAYQSFSEADIVRLSRLVPDTVDTVRLVMDVSNIAAKQGLLIKNIKISEPTKDTKENTNSPIGSPIGAPASSADGLTLGAIRIGATNQDFNSIDLSFSVTGSYERFIAFLQDLERSLRILDVTEVKFSTPTDSLKGNNYDFGIGLRAYWLK